MVQDLIRKASQMHTAQGSFAAQGRNLRIAERLSLSLSLGLCVGNSQVAVGRTGRCGASSSRASGEMGGPLGPSRGASLGLSGGGLSARAQGAWARSRLAVSFA